MKPETTKPLVAARQTAEATVSVENTSQIPTALGPQLENPRRAAIANVTLAVVAMAVVAVAVAVEVHLTAPSEELVAAAIAETEATRTAMSQAMHVAAMTLATRITRSA
jgi:hypothetical protein